MNRFHTVGGSDYSGVWKSNLYRERERLPWDVKRLKKLVEEGMNPKTTLEGVLRVAHTVRRCVESKYDEQLQYNVAMPSSTPTRPTRLDRFTPDSSFVGGFNRELTKVAARHQRLATSSPLDVSPAVRVDAQLAVGGITADMRTILLDPSIVPMLYFWLDARVERGMSGTRLKVHVGHIFSMLLGHSPVTDDLIVLNPRFFHGVVLGFLYDVDPEVVAVGSLLIQKVSELEATGHIIVAGAASRSLQPEGEEAILPAVVGLLGRGMRLCHFLMEEESVLGRSESSPRPPSSFLSSSKLFGRSQSEDVTHVLGALVAQTEVRHPATGAPILARENEADTVTCLLTALVNLSANPRAQFALSRCTPLVYALVELVWRAGDGLEDQVASSNAAISDFHLAVDVVLEELHRQEAEGRRLSLIHASKLYAPDSYQTVYSPNSSAKLRDSTAPFGKKAAVAAPPRGALPSRSAGIIQYNGVQLRIDVEGLELDCDPVPLDAEKYISPVKRAALAAQVLANLLYYRDNIAVLRSQCPTLIPVLSESLSLSQQHLAVNASTSGTGTPKRPAGGGGTTPRTPLMTSRSQLSGVLSVKTPTSRCQPSITASGGLMSPSLQDTASQQQSAYLEQLGNACTVALEFVHNRDVNTLELDMLTEMQRASPGSIRRAVSVSIPHPTFGR